MKIYFIYAPSVGAVKIGITQGSTEKRLKEIQANSPVELFVVAECEGDRRTEAALHRMFESINIHGEWFKETPELVTYIENLGIHPEITENAYYSDILDLWVSGLSMPKIAKLKNTSKQRIHQILVTQKYKEFIRDTER